MRKLMTLVRRITAPHLCSTISLHELYYAIKTGLWNGEKFDSSTLAIQSLTDHNQQNVLKRQNLMAVIPNGVFPYKDDRHMCCYSTYIAMDYDGIATPERMAEIMQTLRNCPYVRLAFRTPSGKGLKAIIEHDNNDPCYHTELFDQIIQLLNIPEADKVVKALSQGHYIPYDPIVWYNPRPEAFHFVHNPGYHPLTAHSSSMATTGVKVVGYANIKNAAAKIMLPAGCKSDDSIFNIIDAAHERRYADRKTRGHRKNSVFREASQLCKAGVDVDYAVRRLLDVYGPLGAGLPEADVRYQAMRGYENNMTSYGSTRNQFR